MGQTAVPGQKSKKKGVAKEDHRDGKNGWAIKVADATMDGNKLRVTIASDHISPLIDGPARNLAYQQRLEWGMANAGIEATGGTYVPDKEYAAAKKEGRDVGLWHADFLITPGI